MKNIALVTDSTTDLNESMQKEFDAHILRLKVDFGKQIFEDGDLSPVEFYLRLLREQETPSTIPPSIDDFTALYESLLDSHEEIISIHLSEALSKTIAIAREARVKLGAANRIHLVDSGSVSLGTALLVAEAAKEIRDGLETKDILKNLHGVQNNTETMFILDTLLFLRRGGRIGRLRGMVASFLNVKPILQVTQGEFDAAGRARDLDQAMETLVNLFREKSQGRRVIGMGVVHGSARDAGMMLKRILENTFAVETNYFSEVGPVIGAHSGPGLVGAALRFAETS